MPAGLARFWVPRRGSRGPVSMPAATPSPTDRSRGRASSESHDVSHRPASFDRSDLPGFHALIAASPARVHFTFGGLAIAEGGSASTPHGTSQVPLRSVLGLSQPLDGFLRALASRACCIPRPRPGLAPVQGLHPHPQPDLPRREFRAPWPLLVPRLVDRSRPPARSDLGFEVLLRGRIRTAEAVRSLPQVSCSSGPWAMPAMTRVTSGQPLLTFARTASCLRTPTTPLVSSVFSPAAPASSVSR
jgi:hypothetical protein